MNKKFLAIGLALVLAVSAVGITYAFMNEPEPVEEVVEPKPWYQSLIGGIPVIGAPLEQTIFGNGTDNPLSSNEWYVTSWDMATATCTLDQKFPASALSAADHFETGFGQGSYVVRYHRADATVYDTPVTGDYLMIVFQGLEYVGYDIMQGGTVICSYSAS